MSRGGWSIWSARWSAAVFRFWRRGRWWVERVDEAADCAKPYHLYLVGGEQPWCAVMVCPCGCGDRLELPLFDNPGPRWRLRAAHGTCTLEPSVWRTRGCGAHFFFREGRVVWAKGSVRRSARI